MKKLLLTLVLLLIAGTAGAQTLHNVQNATVAWDAVPFPTGTTGAIYYQVYTKNDLVSTTGTKVGAEIQATQLLIGPFAPGVTYYVGVETIFWQAGAATAQRSATLAWSHNAADCEGGNTFGFSFSPTLDKIKNLRKL